MSSAEEFAEAFFLQLNVLAAELVGRAWTDSSRFELRSRIETIAKREARCFAVTDETVDAVVAYALLIIQIDGVPLSEATFDAVRMARGF